MTRCLLLLTFSALVAPAAVPSFHVAGTDAAPWEKVLGSVGMAKGSATGAQILVLGPAAKGYDVEFLAQKHIVVLEGVLPPGAKPSATTVSVRRVVDVHNPSLQIVWKDALEIQSTSLPAAFQVFASEKWKNAPLLAGKRTGEGAVLWLATAPGTTGMERYPYLLQALTDLGLELPLQSRSLWAFFDSSYRIRADPDYLARRWRAAGVSVLHVAAWHNMEADPTQDEFLKNVIEACHRNAILVYAWLELPHVSDKFWADHPEWRENTALGQDANLDWRKLMNLSNPQCRKAVSKNVSELLSRFDWDGVNLAELYFESLEGASNPARFTPMNDDVRAEFRTLAGFDPKLIFDPQSQYYASKNPSALRQFLDFRAVLASRMQSDWLSKIQEIRKAKPYLGVVLTHIDDRFDPAIRDELGADIARTLPLMKSEKSTLLVEDPANLWDLGPDRYPKLATKYRELTADTNSVGVDINVVERYQDVYPTKKQTGVELFELVHEAAASFGRVALYFENSIGKQDLPLLPAAASTAHISAAENGGFEITSRDLTRVDYHSPAAVDGRVWPVQGGNWVLLPSGTHRLTSGTLPAVALADFNGDLRSGFARPNSSAVSYISKTRAIAVLGSPVASIKVDGVPFAEAEPAGKAILLPAGEHLVEFNR